MTTFDVSELVEFAMDIEGVRENIGPRIHSAFQVSSTHIKKDWNKSLAREGTNRMKGIGSTVDFDITVGGRASAFAAMGYVSSIESEIGPNIERYSALRAAFAGWFEEGAAGVPGTQAGAKALKKNEGDIEDGIALAAVDAILDATR